MRGFDVARHFCDLVSNHLMIDKSATKRFAHACIFDGFLHADTCIAIRHGCEHEALVVEIRHDGGETTVLLADQVCNGNADVVESNQLEPNIQRTKQGNECELHPVDDTVPLPRCNSHTGLS